MVGADGATHVGAFDVTFMASLPHMVTMAPSNEAELINMIATAAAIDDGPSCFRCLKQTSPEDVSLLTDCDGLIESTFP